MKSKYSIQKNYRILMFIPLFLSCVFSFYQDANAANIKWFNKDLYNTSGIAGNDIDFLFAGATGAQIQAANAESYNHPGFTGPTYGDAMVDSVPVGVVRWEGPVPNDPQATNKIHLGVKLDLDKLPDGFKMSHVVITQDGEPVAIAPACAKPEVVFVSEDVIGINITSPFNNPGITIDEVNYAFVSEPVPLENLNGENVTILWSNLPGSFDMSPDETIRIANVPIAPLSTHIVVSARVRFIGNPELGAGHVFFQSELPSASSIPTVSEWGLIIMAALLVAAGAVIIKRRKTVVT
ncbi:MAG: IPTL-CTERM sorting domain-containing protein [Phycisphaerae bacterium]|nr:IPTL-CTERM sorting domain-containing protein [Phycisphaerae bacterium]